MPCEMYRVLPPPTEMSCRRGRGRRRRRRRCLVIVCIRVGGFWTGGLRPVRHDGQRTVRPLAGVGVRRHAIMELRVKERWMEYKVVWNTKRSRGASVAGGGVERTLIPINFWNIASLGDGVGGGESPCLAPLPRPQYRGVRTPGVILLRAGYRDIHPIVWSCDSL